MNVPVIVFDGSKDLMSCGVRGKKITPHLIVINEQALNSEPGTKYFCLGIHGCGVVQGDFVSEAKDYQSILNRLKKPEGLTQSLPEKTRGSLCAYVHDRLGGVVYVNPDPLGGALVFYYINGSRLYCSSDIKKLIAVLNRDGIVLERSIDFSIESAIFGNGGLNSSAYKDLHALEPYQYIEFDGDKASIKEYVFKRNYSSRSGSYQEKMDRIRLDILENVRAASAGNDFSVRMAHLTGGFDSRLVLGALLHEGLHKDYLYFCTGDAASNSDRKIFEQLAREYGLNTTNHIGYDRGFREYSYKEKIIAPYRYSAGLFKFSPDDSCFSLEKTQVLSGGYGEILRSFYAARISDDMANDIDYFAKESFGSIYFDASSSILNRDFSRSILDQLKVKLNAYSDLAPSARLDALYLNVRNRYFVGNSAKLWSEVHSRFDPLYSLNSSALALSLSHSERAGNVLGFDLLQSFDAKLAGLPFEDDKISRHYLAHRQRPVEISFSRNSDALKVDNRVQFSGVKTIRGKKFSLTAEDKEVAKRVGVLPNQAMLYRATREDLAAYLDDPKVAACFDKKALTNLFSERIKKKSQIKSALLLYENLAYAFS